MGLEKRWSSAYLSNGPKVLTFGETPCSEISSPVRFGEYLTA